MDRSKERASPQTDAALAVRGIPLQRQAQQNDLAWHRSAQGSSSAPCMRCEGKQAKKGKHVSVPLAQTSGMNQRVAARMQIPVECPIAAAISTHFALIMKQLSPDVDVRLDEVALSVVPRRLSRLQLRCCFFEIAGPTCWM